MTIISLSFSGVKDVSADLSSTLVRWTVQKQGLSFISSTCVLKAE